MSDFRDTLAQQAEAETMACIGCHDCMLACPLPEAHAITIAELNAAVHLPIITAPNVVAFLSACTQCRQCVPVCPADLSRADIVLFNKMKVEDQVPNQQLMLQVGDEVVPSHHTLDGMATELASLRLFNGVGKDDLRRLLLKVTLRQLEQHEELCREGEFHERLYVVLSGSLEQTSSVSGGAAGQKVRILVFGPGSFFGEMAIMADQPEPFTVTALTTSIVVEMPKAALHRLMNQSQVFKSTMDELYRRRALWTYARMPSVLGSLPEAAMEELLRGAELQMVKQGATLFKEGDAPKDVFLVRSGFLRVSRRIEKTGPVRLATLMHVPGELLPRQSSPSNPGHERSLPGKQKPPEETVLVYFREGDLFGALALALGERGHSFTVTASSRAEVIRIPGRLLMQVLARYPQAHEALVKGAMEVEQVARAQELSPRAPEPAQQAGRAHTQVLPFSWSVLVDQGVAQGREVLVIDQNLCVNCQNCIDACGRRHGDSRLQLRGLQVENLLFPTACRHCADPVCLLCSVNGIIRKPTGEIAIVEDNCIGCGACAERCPYGNISMHPVERETKGWIASLWDLLRGGANKAAYERELDPKVPQKAVKCDLCSDYSDYACVTACPVGAAFRVDPKVAIEGAKGANAQAQGRPSR